MHSLGHNSVPNAAAEQRFLSQLQALPAQQLCPLFLVSGGFMDGLLQHAYKIIEKAPLFGLKPNHWHMYYREHYEAKNSIKLARIYANKKIPIVLLGHSWGASGLVRAIETSLCPVDMLITLDAVSRRAPSLLTSVNNWINIYVDYQHANWSGDNIVARIGGPWEKVKGASKNIVSTIPFHRHAWPMFQAHALQTFLAFQAAFSE